MSIQPRRRWSWILALTLLAEVLPMASPKPVAAADPPMPAAASTHYQALAVSAGDYHTCAIATDGALACWG